MHERNECNGLEGDIDSMNTCMQAMTRGVRPSVFRFAFRFALYCMNAKTEELWCQRQCLPQTVHRIQARTPMRREASFRSEFCTAIPSAVVPSTSAATLYRRTHDFVQSHNHAIALHEPASTFAFRCKSVEIASIKPFSASLQIGGRLFAAMLSFSIYIFKSMQHNADYIDCVPVCVCDIRAALFEF